MADTNIVLRLNTWKKCYKAIFEPILQLHQIRMTRSESRTESTSQVNITLRTVVFIMAWDSLRDYRQESRTGSIIQSDTLQRWCFLNFPDGEQRG